MKYLIAALEIHDYKMLHTVTITPAADAYWVILGGENAHGKTGVLEAIDALLGGADAVLEDPVRHGAERAVLSSKLEPDDGSPPLTIKRVIEADGKTKLEVRDDIGRIKGAQDLLNTLIGKGRLLDPLDFLRLKATEQRERLLQIIDADGKIAEIDALRQRWFDQRTEVGRELKRTKGAVDSTPEVVPGEPISVSELSDELQRLHVEMAAQVQAHHRHKAAEGELEQAERAVGAAELALERAQQMLEMARQKREVAIAAVSIAQAALPEPGAHVQAGRRTITIRDEIRQAESHNQTVAAQRAAQASRAHLVNERDRHQYEHDELDRQIDEIDADKQTRLTAAKLPYPELAFTATGLTYKGAPFSQASGAQRVCIAIAMAAAVNPQLRDVRVRDAAIISDTTMPVVAELARSLGIRLWLERVGTRDAGVIEIVEGKIAEPPQGNLFR